jgi:membrane protein YdbS with pleckstrin-like domain
MPYPKELLNKHEKVVVDSHPHWLYFLEPMLAAAAAFAVYFIFVISNRVDITWGWTRFLLFVLACLGLWALLRLFRWRSVEFVVTNDRVIYRSGVFAKRGIEIPLARVNNVNFSQGILERMVGAGNLMIESGGEDGQSHFTDVRDPQQVQRIIHEQIEVYRQRPTGAFSSGPAPSGTPMPPPPPGAVAAAPVSAAGASVADELEKLEALFHRGTITQAEFEAQKQKLLGG